MNYIKSYFKDWNLFERIFLIFGLILSISTTIIFEGNVINTLYVASYLITALLLAKGKVECYFIGFISVFFYGIVSYRQAYYGELLITIFLTFPIMFIGMINWIKNRNKEDNTVIINTLSKKEIVIVILLQFVLYWIYYFILKVFNTQLLAISALSVVTSVLASYFEARRSELNQICYIANDLIIITLWLIPIIKGDIALISVLVGPLLLLVNDIYGTYNWKSLKKKQEKQLKNIM